MNSNNKDKDNRIAKAERQEKHVRRLGTRKPACRNCVEKEPVALTGSSPDVDCYECQSKAQGRSPIEDHHPAGRHNDPFTIPLPGNDHRYLSEMQRDWPLDTLRNPQGSPLRKAAAAIRGFLDYLRMLIDRVLGWVPDFLEGLDEALTRLLGLSWWNELGQEGGKDES